VIPKCSSCFPKVRGRLRASLGPTLRAHNCGVCRPTVRNAGLGRSNIWLTHVNGTIVHRKLRFGPFEVSIGERVVRRDGRVLLLGDRALDILTHLADRPGEVIAKQELMDHVWSDVTVEEGSLRVHVAAIRKALGDGQFGNDTSQTSRDGAIRSLAPSSRSLVARKSGTPISPTCTPLLQAASSRAFAIRSPTPSRI